MAFIHWEFLMRLDQLARVIVNFLPETHRGFARVHVLEITRQPAQLARHVEPVAPSAAGQFVSLAELLFVLRPRAHAMASFILATMSKKSRMPDLGRLTTCWAMKRDWSM